MGQGLWWSSLRKWFGGASDTQRAVMAEIDRIAAETKSRLLLVDRYRRGLAAPLTKALGGRPADDRTDTRSGGNQIQLDPERWQTDIALRALFISPQEMRAWLKRQHEIRPVVEAAGDGKIFALLLGGHRRRQMFVTEQDGEIFRRDVPLQASVFEDLRLVAPATDLETARAEVIHRILRMVFIQALDAIARLKEDRDRLEQEHELLEFVVRTADRATAKSRAAAQAAADTLPEVHRRLQELERRAESPEGQLAYIVGTLADLADPSQVRPLTFHLNASGTLVSTTPVKDSLGTCILADYRLPGQEPQVALWVSLKRGDVTPP